MVSQTQSMYKADLHRKISAEFQHHTLALHSIASILRCIPSIVTVSFVLTAVQTAAILAPVRVRRDGLSRPVQDLALMYLTGEPTLERLV